MPVTMTHHDQNKFVEIALSGKVTRTDYEDFVPGFEQLLQDHGPLRMLVELRDFHGWTFGGLWEDIKFDVRHFRSLERVAIVGEKRWHEAMALFCKPFTTAKVRYFESFEIPDARTWLTREREPDALDPETQPMQQS